MADEYITPDHKLMDAYKTVAGYGEDKAEYFVRVKWLRKVQDNNSVNEIGLFGNQNSVARPRAPKWEHTVKRLK